MNLPITAAHAAWVPIVAWLFRAIGPMRASAFAVVGGLILLPRGTVMAGPIPFDKRTAIGLGLALGILLFDRAAIARARPSWLDLPMIALGLAPLSGMIVGSAGIRADVIDQVVARLGCMILPYAAGRLYFGDRDGPRRVAVSVEIGGLLAIPICLYEEFAGPGRYLAGLIYGTPAIEGMTYRLGGNRPEGFLENGIDLAGWMALATVTAAWTWIGSGWPTSRRAGWIPALALLLTTLSCRGVYGYITLGLGLGTLAATRLFRTRAFLVLLALIPLAYMATRISGVWDGKVLADMARDLGRGNTVAIRLQSEEEVITQVLARNPAIGFGFYPWHGDLKVMLDGQWGHLLYTGGLLGLAVYLSALYLVPATLAISSPRGRPMIGESVSASWGLAAFLLLQMNAGLHNDMIWSPTALVAGSLIGRFLARRSGPDPVVGTSQARPSASQALPLPLILASIVLAILEIIGRLPRNPHPARSTDAAIPTSSSPPARNESESRSN